MENEMIGAAECLFTYKLYVPRAKRAACSVNLAKAQALCGGWTVYFCEGGWIDPSGEIIREPVEIHEFLVSTDKALSVRSYLRQASRDLLDAGEQAVLLVDASPVVQTMTYTRQPN